MFNLIPGYDSNGALIERLYQWDLNQTITVKHLDFEKAPVFHFCNRKSKESLAVQSQATGNGYTASVPNILLQQALKITAFIYYEGDGFGKTVFRTEIPVEPKPKPTDYLYDDNIADVLKKGSALLNEIDEKIENAVSNADKAATKAGTATKAANDAAAAAREAAAAVGEEIDGIMIVDNDDDSKYLGKFRISSGHPALGITKLQ